MPVKHSRNYETVKELHERLAGSGLIPPQCIDVEQSVLGAMLTDKRAATSILEVIGERSIDESPFYREAHTAIYRAAVNLDTLSEPVDLLSVTARMRFEGTLDEAGGPAYLVELTMLVVTTAHVVNHARLILETDMLRRLISVCEEAKLQAYIREYDSFEIMDRAESKIFKLSSIRNQKQISVASDLQYETIEYFQQIHNNGGILSGVPSGLEELDSLTTGWQKTDLIIIAARPSMGKSAFAMTLARNAALHPVKEYRVPVAIFSLEMGKKQLMQRILCGQAQVDMQAARKGKLGGDDWRKLAGAGEMLHIGKDIFIDDTGAITPLELRSKSRRLVERNGVGLIIVDYIQLMEPGEKMDSREQAVSKVSRSLKALAKELNVPVIALSQLNRSLESRAGHNKRPMLSDLRESGAIEQDADNVLFIYRPEVYDIEQYEDGKATVGTAEIIVGKQRNGPIGSVVTAFRDKYGRFDNLAQIEFGNEEGGSF